MKSTAVVGTKKSEPVAATVAKGSAKGKPSPAPAPAPIAAGKGKVVSGKQAATPPTPAPIKKNNVTEMPKAVEVETKAKVEADTPVEVTPRIHQPRVRLYTPCNLPFGADTAVRFIKGDQITAIIRHNGNFAVRDSGGNLEIFKNIAAYYASILRRPQPSSAGNFSSIAEATIDDMANELGDIERAADWVAPPARTRGEIERDRKMAERAEGMTVGEEISNETETEIEVVITEEDVAAETLAVGETGIEIDEETGLGDVVYVTDAESEEQLIEREKRIMKTNPSKRAVGKTTVRVKGAKGKAAKGAKGKHAARTKPASGEPRVCPPCKCGCGEQVGKPTSSFLPGHDARFHGWIKKIGDGRMKYAELPNDEARKNVKKAVAEGGH